MPSASATVVERRMDWKVALATFGTVFLAELGDKTQLATLAFATTERSRWAVFVGAACALVATSAVAVLAGDAVVRAVPPAFLKRAAGGLFVAIGAWGLWAA